jgi:hypothetical protein
MLCGGFERRTLTMRGVYNAQKRPDEAPRQHDRFRLAQLNDFLDCYKSVGDEEDEERQITDGMLCQVNAHRGLLGMERRGCGQNQGKYRKGQHPQPSGKTERRHPVSTNVERHKLPAILRGNTRRGAGQIAGLPRRCPPPRLCMNHTWDGCAPGNIAYGRMVNTTYALADGVKEDAFSLKQKIALSAKEETELSVVIRRSISGIMGLGWSAGWRRELAPAQYALVGGVFTAAYLGLEWLTRVHELEALGITLWNPVKALSLGLLLLKGVAYAPVLFLAALLVDLFIYGAAKSVASTVATSAVVALGYAALAAGLTQGLGFALRRSDLRNVIAALVTVPAGTFVKACFYCAFLMLFGDLPARRYWEAVPHLWVGDTVGIIILLPVAMAFSGSVQRLLDTKPTRTAEHHRAAVLQKMGARTVSHLVRMSMSLQSRNTLIQS